MGGRLVDVWARREELMPASILRTAHGTAKDGGALLVAEVPPLDELKPLNPADTAVALAVRKANGRPYEKGNAAAKGKGPSVLLVNTAPDAPEEVRKLNRRASSLKNRRRIELSVQHKCKVSSGVEGEIKSWALALAWSDAFYRSGDAIRGASFAEKASGHDLKAIAKAEREAASSLQQTGDQDLAKGMAKAFAASEHDEGDGA
jgi:hypothetical protein